MACKTAPEVHCKTPSEVRKLDFDFGGDDLATGETITGTGTISVSPSGELTAVSPVISSPKVQVEVASGVSGTTYSVTITVTTSGGQTLQALGRIRVEAA